jgi:hypothetical protein
MRKNLIFLFFCILSSQAVRAQYYVHYFGPQAKQVNGFDNLSFCVLKIK